MTRRSMTRRSKVQALLIGRAGPRISTLAAELRNTDVDLEMAEDPPVEPRNSPWIYVAAAADPLGLRPDPDHAAEVSAAWSERGGDHLIVISSAAAEEPSHHHPLRLDESRNAPRRFGNPLCPAWCAVEETARRIHGECGSGSNEDQRRLTVLRPTPWPIRTGGCWWGRRLRGAFAAVAPGFDPNLQLLAVSDLASAVERCLVRRQEAGQAIETYNVAPEGVIPLRKALARAGVRRVPWPLSTGPKGQRDFIRYPSTVDDAKIRRDLGYSPRFSSAAVAGDGPGGDREHDPFGLDRVYLQRLSRTLFRFLHNVWWRVEYRGSEFIPRQGKGVLVGVHRGFQPWDGVMVNYWVARELGRVLRFLVHPALFKFPFLAPYMTKLGGIPACRENGDWVLQQGQLLAIYPEGIRGAFRPYDGNIYRLGKMGRDEYVRFALRSGAPIIPFVTLGQAEIYPILYKLDWRWWKRWTEWPTFPITPTLGLVPLPSKWHTRILEPIPVDHLPPEAADNNELVAQLASEVKGRMQNALDEMVEQRGQIIGGIFRGSIFAEPVAAPSRETSVEDPT